MSWNSHIPSDVATPEPQPKEAAGLIPHPPSWFAKPPDNKSNTSRPSPTNITISAAALSKFVYHNSNSALPSTGRLCFMTTECVAVIAEGATPKTMLKTETEVPSRKTLTRLQERNMRREDQEWRKTREVQTVKGRASLRATW
jgi:hypothetical protein